MKYKKENTFGRYVFKLSKIIEKSSIKAILRQYDKDIMAKFVG